MAKLRWGKVLMHDQVCGYLQEAPGERIVFTYDNHYLEGGAVPLSEQFPLRAEPFISEIGLHPYFDNLVAEGWLEDAQRRLLGKRSATRFELLLAFGLDCIGAVSVLDPEPEKLVRLDNADSREASLSLARASLSGVQPKQAIIRKQNKYYPVQSNQLSSHIAKFASTQHPDVIYNEYLTTLAIRALLPKDTTVEATLGYVENIDKEALIIERFDRTFDGKQLHFEEFNQILGLRSSQKYDGDYQDMADFMQNNPHCLQAEIFKLYLRILAGILVGNTDMHFKNFALFHTEKGFRLTPNYDQVFAAMYGYHSIALKLCHTENIYLGKLKARQIIKLGEAFQLSRATINMAYEQLSQNISKSIQVVNHADLNTPQLKKELTEQIKKRWNGTFNLIGQALLKKP